MACRTLHNFQHFANLAKAFRKCRQKDGGLRLTGRFWLTDVIVAHGDEAEVLLAGALTGGSEEGDGATVRGLGSNPPVVGIHFGIKDADVHVFTRGPMMTVRLTPHSRLRRLVKTSRLRLTAWSRPP